MTTANPDKENRPFEKVDELKALLNKSFPRADLSEARLNEWRAGDLIHVSFSIGDRSFTRDILAEACVKAGTLDSLSVSNHGLEKHVVYGQALQMLAEDIRAGNYDLDVSRRITSTRRSVTNPDVSERLRVYGNFRDYSIYRPKPDQLALEIEAAYKDSDEKSLLTVLAEITRRFGLSCFLLTSLYLDPKSVAFDENRIVRAFQNPKLRQAAVDHAKQNHYRARLPDRTNEVAYRHFLTQIREDLQAHHRPSRTMTQPAAYLEVLKEMQRGGFYIAPEMFSPLEVRYRVQPFAAYVMIIGEAYKLADTMVKFSSWQRGKDVNIEKAFTDIATTIVASAYFIFDESTGKFFYSDLIRKAGGKPVK